MKVNSKLLKIIVKSQLLSIIFAAISRIHINLFTGYTYMLKNTVIVSLSLIFFTAFCIIMSFVFLNESIMNIFLIAITYVIYWRIFLTISLFHINNPNYYGIGILGLSLEMFLGLFHYVIVIISSVIAVSIHIIFIKKAAR